MNVNSKPKRDFSRIEGLSICLAFIAIQLSSELNAAWGNYFYSPPAGTGRIVYVAIGLSAWIFIAGRVTDFIIDPLIGAWSDKTPTRPGRWRILPIAGRRRPFLFYGAFLTLVTSIATWYPPVPETSIVNFIYGTAIISLHWVFFGLCFIGLQSLGPEIARSPEGRTEIGMWTAWGLAVGLAIAYIVPGILIESLDPARHAVPPSESPVGFQRMAIIMSIVSLVLFLLPVWLVRERFDSERTPQTTPGLRTIYEAFFNRPFLMYFGVYFFFQLGQLATQRVLPYWAQIGLGGNEATVSAMMMPFMLMVFAVFPFIPALSRRFKLKWLMFACVAILTSGFPPMYFLAVWEPSTTVASSPVLDWWMRLAQVENTTAGLKTFLGALMFAWSGIGQGLFYALLIPMLGEIIDMDERRSGERREAVYNGLQGAAIKSAQAIAILISNLSMQAWGNSVADPDGIYYVPLIATGFGIIALGLIAIYPVYSTAKGGSPAVEAR